MVQNKEISRAAFTEEDRKKLISYGLLVLCCIMIFTFYFASTPYQYQGHPVVNNMDALLYPQYAKAWAEGHPYQFNAGDPPTTGCTSHTYPLILSLFYLVGFQSYALTEVMFWLNALFFIISVFLFWKIVQQIDPDNHWKYALLYALSGHTVMTILRLSDMGLFLLFTLWVWKAVLQRSWIKTSLLLFFLPFIRPEGMIIIFSIGLIFIVRHVFKRNRPEEAKYEWVVLGSGLLGIFVLAIVNLSLTGMIGFDSTQGKGLAEGLHPIAFLAKLSQELWTMYKEIIWGLAGNLRQFYFLPIVGGLFILYGMIKQAFGQKDEKKHPSIQFIWLLSFFVTILMIAASGLPMMHFDRYLLWVIPILIFWMIFGVYSAPISSLYKQCIFIVLLLSQIFTIPNYLILYLTSMEEMIPIIQEVELVPTVLPENLKIGVQGGSGIKYLLPEYTIVNMGGVTSPYFRQIKDKIARNKTIQYDPNLQFDYLLSSYGLDADLEDLIVDSLNLEIPYPKRNPITLYKMDWQRLQGIDEPIQLSQAIAAGRITCIDHLDIGYSQHQKKCSMKITSRYPYSIPLPFLVLIDSTERKTVDAAIGVLGSIKMTMKCDAGIGHLFVIRSLVREDLPYRSLDRAQKLTINTNTVKEIEVITETGFHQTISMQPFLDRARNNVMEWLVEIPKEYIPDDQLTLTVIGDHIACDYWLFSLK